MDPLSHAVVGRAVTELLDDGGRLGRGAGAAAVVGALSPDVDLLLARSGWDVYLRAHELGTHSMPGALVAAACAAALVHGVTRGSRYGALITAASAGALSHLALDVLSGARIRLAWPFTQTPVSLPLVAMADPWLLAMLLAGALALWTRRQRMRPVARLVVGAAIAFLCLKGALLDRALRSANLERTSPRVIEARWGSLTQWYVFDRTPGELRAWRVDGRGGPARAILSWPIGAETPRVQASHSLETVRNFLDVHELGFATEESAGADRVGVFWSDIRYCRQPDPGERRIACGLWFGGVFGPDGRVLAQQVKIGAWLQSRSPPR
jgi:membrane-bound metal-dependent hydrolase YbcI (DUF457 family)